MDYLAHIPKEHRPDCANCPFSDPATKGPRHKPVAGFLRPRCQGVLVGESPGADEVDQQEVFIGQTGRWLKSRLQENHLNFDDMTVINSVGCQPPRGMKTDTNMGHAAHACYRLFHYQYAQYSSKPTLAMGKWAGHSANAGKTITVETGRGFIRGKLILTWHPTYAAFYNPWKAGEFIIDVQRFHRLIHNKLEQPPKVLIRPTVADVVRLVRHSHNVLAVDIETRAPHGQPSHLGKDPTRADLRTIALGTPDQGVAHWWGSNPSVQRVIVKVLEDPSTMKVFHNGYFFDLRVLQRFGVNTKNVIDTRDMRRAVSATSRLSLRFLASVYSDFAPWKEDEK